MNLGGCSDSAVHVPETKSRHSLPLYTCSAFLLINYLINSNEMCFSLNVNDNMLIEEQKKNVALCVWSDKKTRLQSEKPKRSG